MGSPSPNKTMDRLLNEKEMWEIVKQHEQECAISSAPLESWTYIPYRAKLLIKGQDKKTLKAVGEWLIETCPHTTNPIQQRKLCNRCRNELIEALKRGEWTE
jgi:hypothetical protein